GHKNAIAGNRVAELPGDVVRGRRRADEQVVVAQILKVPVENEPGPLQGSLDRFSAVHRSSLVNKGVFRIATITGATAFAGFPGPSWTTSQSGSLRSSAVSSSCESVSTTIRLAPFRARNSRQPGFAAFTSRQASQYSNGKTWACVNISTGISRGSAQMRKSPCVSLAKIVP